MSRYIDAEWLYNELGDINMDIYTDEVKEYIDSAPHIEIIRCGECKLGGTEDCPMDEIDDEYYCNFGEREGE